MYLNVWNRPWLIFILCLDNICFVSQQWHSLLDRLGSSEFCIFGNQTFVPNATFVNSTNVTGPTPVGFTTVTIPILDLSIIPSDDFRGVVNNVTYVTAAMSAAELGLPVRGLLCMQLTQS